MLELQLLNSLERLYYTNQLFVLVHTQLMPMLMRRPLRKTLDMWYFSAGQDYMINTTIILIIVAGTMLDASTHLLCQFPKLKLAQLTLA